MPDAIGAGTFAGHNADGFNPPPSFRDTLSEHSRLCQTCGAAAERMPHRKNGRARGPDGVGAAIGRREVAWALTGAATGTNGKAAPEGGLSSKTGGLRSRAGALNQARISTNAGILVTAAVDRGWWLDTGSPPFWLLSQGG